MIDWSKEHIADDILVYGKTQEEHTILGVNTTLNIHSVGHSTGFIINDLYRWS